MSVVMCYFLAASSRRVTVLSSPWDSFFFYFGCTSMSSSNHHVFPIGCPSAFLRSSMVNSIGLTSSSEVIRLLSQVCKCSMLRTWRVVVPLLFFTSYNSKAKNLSFLDLLMSSSSSSFIFSSTSKLFFFCSASWIISLTATGSSFLSWRPMLWRRKIRVSISDSENEAKSYFIRSNSKWPVVD